MIKKHPVLCKLGFHKPDKENYVRVYRRRNDRHGGKYYGNYAVCSRCGRLCFRIKRGKEGKS